MAPKSNSQRPFSSSSRSIRPDPKYHYAHQVYNPCLHTNRITTLTKPLLLYHQLWNSTHHPHSPTQMITSCPIIQSPSILLPTPKNAKQSARASPYTQTRAEQPSRHQVRVQVQITSEVICLSNSRLPWAQRTAHFIPSSQISVLKLEAIPYRSQLKTWAESLKRARDLVALLDQQNGSWYSRSCIKIKIENDNRLELQSILQAQCASSWIFIENSRCMIVSLFVSTCKESCQAYKPLSWKLQKSWGWVFHIAGWIWRLNPGIEVLGVLLGVWYCFSFLEKKKSFHESKTEVELILKVRFWIDQWH